MKKLFAVLFFCLLYALSLLIIFKLKLEVETSFSFVQKIMVFISPLWFFGFLQNEALKEKPNISALWNKIIFLPLLVPFFYMIVEILFYPEDITSQANMTVTGLLFILLFNIFVPNLLRKKTEIIANALNKKVIVHVFFLTSLLIISIFLNQKSYLVIFIFNMAGMIMGTIIPWVKWWIKLFNKEKMEKDQNYNEEAEFMMRL